MLEVVVYPASISQSEYNTEAKSMIRQALPYVQREEDKRFLYNRSRTFFEDF